MKQNKLFPIFLCLIIQIFLNINISWATDWSKYKEVSLEDIIKNTDEYYKQHGKKGVWTTVEVIQRCGSGCPEYYSLSII